MPALCSLQARWLRVGATFETGRGSWYAPTENIAGGPLYCVEGQEWGRAGKANVCCFLSDGDWRAEEQHHCHLWQFSSCRSEVREPQSVFWCVCVCTWFKMYKRPFYRQNCKNRKTPAFKAKLMLVDLYRCSSLIRFLSWIENEDASQLCIYLSPFIGFSPENYHLEDFNTRRTSFRGNHPSTSRWIQILDLCVDSSFDLLWGKRQLKDHLKKILACVIKM